MIKKDYGKWDLPKSWNEISLAKLMHIEKLRGEDGALVKIIACITDKSVDEVNELPMPFIDGIISQLAFLQEAPQIEPSATTVINGETYGVNIMEELTLGEWVAVQTIMHNDKNDVAGILAVVCRKPGEVYDTSFENQVYEKRKAMFETAPCTAVLGVIAFFLTLFAVSNQLSQQYSTAKELALDSIAKNIKTLRKGGGGVGFFTRISAMARLRKLKRHINTTF